MCHKFGKQLAHNSWSPHAHQLLCMRISAVMQAHNSCCATGDTNCLNNISYLFQQHILSILTTRRGFENHIFQYVSHNDILVVVINGNA